MYRTRAALRTGAKTNPGRRHSGGKTANKLRLNMKLNHLNHESKTRIILQYRGGLKPSPFWQGLVETQLRKLQGLAAIASAQVTLQWQHEIKPPFRVIILLEVPGPDFHAQASDHTLEAALLKVVHDLERQIRSRTNRRLNKGKTNTQLGFLPGRSRSAAATGA